ncbi:alpha/beta hydrolase [Providencia rettgeri]|nr:alpha/beta hydrolase [Providencia rettgeri]HCR4098128.1 alpha/beta hydrolase [Providencia rettgeri]
MLNGIYKHIKSKLFLLWGLMFAFLYAIPAVSENLKAGQLLTSRLLDSNTRYENAEKEYLVSYLSTSPNNEPVTVFGRIAIPKGTAPENGFPVLSWGNGTTGVAPQCSPSLDNNPDRDAYLNAALANGYAVLRTDYARWGADGPRLELNGQSNANNIADIVSAAHQLPENLANEWVAVGHSLGGGAVLWAASLPPNKKYPLKGAVALAPVGPGVLKFIESSAEGTAPKEAQFFITVTVLGAKATDPSIDINKLVDDSILPQFDAAQRLCVGELAALKPLSQGKYLKEGDDLDKVKQFLSAQDPSSLTLNVPVLVIQGSDDKTTVTPETTKQMVKKLCQNGNTVLYKEYAGQSHRSVIDASKKNTFDFIQKMGFSESINDTGKENGLLGCQTF